MVSFRLQAITDGPHCRLGLRGLFVKIALARWSGTEAVTLHKRLRLIRLAQHYLASHGLAEVPCRFDVVTLTAGRSRARVEVVRDAFRIG